MSCANPLDVTVLADYWLETMGMPLNQRSAHQVIVTQARVELTNWNWEAAEAKLQTVLAADPLNRQAHALLGQVYLSKYTYWHDYAELDQELFPGASVADPEMYRHLAFKGQAEVDIASRLPAAGEETLEGGAEEITGLDPDHPGMTHLLAGKARVLAGDLDAAEREFEEALASAEDSPDLAAYCHLYLGRIAGRRGDKAAARSHFTAIIGMHANGSVTELAGQELRRLSGFAVAR